jgi:hypothetical protein
MATARMTNELRNTIRYAAMSKAFEKEKTQNEESLEKLSRKIYDALYSKEIQEAIALLPKGFIYFRDFGTVLISPNSNSRFEKMSLKFDKPVGWPVEYSYGNDPKIINADLYAEYRKLEEESRSISDAERKLAVSLDQVLRSVNTVSKLIEIWPEGEKFIPDWAKNVVKGSMLPAVCVGDLNDMLSKALGAPLET